MSTRNWNCYYIALLYIIPAFYLHYWSPCTISTVSTSSSCGWLFGISLSILNNDSICSLFRGEGIDFILFDALALNDSFLSMVVTSKKWLGEIDQCNRAILAARRDQCDEELVYRFVKFLARIVPPEDGGFFPLLDTTFFRLRTMSSRFFALPAAFLNVILLKVSLQ